MWIKLDHAFYISLDPVNTQIGKPDDRHGLLYIFRFPGKITSGFDSLISLNWIVESVFEKKSLALITSK